VATYAWPQTGAAQATHGSAAARRASASNSSSVRRSSSALAMPAIIRYFRSVNVSFRP
jgi:hypothetical protein